MGKENPIEGGKNSFYKIYLVSPMNVLEPIPMETFIARHKESDRDEFLGTHQNPFLIVFLPETKTAETKDPSAETAMVNMNQDGPPVSLNEFVYELKLEEREMLKIGRSPSRDICVPVPQVSRTHIVLSRSAEGQWALMDAKSTCGTAINQKRIFPGSRYPLVNGTMITLASAVDFKFHTPEGILSMLG